MPTAYQVTVTGKYRINGVLITCPDCGTDRGLTFLTDAGVVLGVTASCPRGHVWDEPRVPGSKIRQLTDSQKG